jgi:NAD(P)-dependent dehydrogenase (short-subunit alcohol dehydrogenase family)
MRMDDRVVVVTGAGNGLGREHALLFAKQGAKMVVNDFGGSLNGAGGDAMPADKVVAEIKALGGTAVANYDSVSSVEGARRLIDTAIGSYGRIDTLVNNAGILRDKSFAKMALEDFEEVIRVHLFGSVYCTKAAYAHMVEQKFGRIVMTTSGAGTHGNFGQANYAAAKMALLGFMNALSLECEKYNVLINAISPGAATRMTAGMGIDPRWSPAHVSPAVVWLGSELCNVTAHVISAAAAGFGRVHYYETKGVQFDPSKPVSVEMFDDAFGRICDLSTATPTIHGSVAGLISSRLESLGGSWEGHGPISHSARTRLSR